MRKDGYAELMAEIALDDSFARKVIENFVTPSEMTDTRSERIMMSSNDSE